MADWTLLSSSLDGGNREALSQALKLGNLPMKTTTQLDLDGVPYVTLLEPLAALNGHFAVAVQRNLTVEEAHFRELEAKLLGIALAGLALSAIAVTLIARTVSRPLLQLAQAPGGSKPAITCPIPSSWSTFRVPTRSASWNARSAR